MTTTAATRFESTRHASAAAHRFAHHVAAGAPDDPDEARRYFKREAAYADRRFEMVADPTVRLFEAVFASRMRVEMEVLADARREVI